MGFLPQAIKGLTWMGILRGSTRLISFLRLIILARILTPVQFGFFGIASLVLAFLEMLTETGVNVFFIQEEGEIKEYINTAWVVSILRGILISLFIILSAPLVVSFFNSSEAYSLILLISLVPFLRGFINPAIVKFQKELAFGKEFLIRFSVFSFDCLVGIIFAILTQQASSLVFGLIAGVLLEIVLSFIFIRPVPKFAFDVYQVKRIIGRGKWMTAAGVFNYLFHHLDDIVVGRLLNPYFLGLYQMAYKISTLPLTEVTDVFGKVTFPIYVKIAGDPQRIKKAFIKTTLTISLLTIPFGLILFLFSKEITLLALGEKWINAASAVQVLAIFGVVRAISGSSSALFLAVKRQEFVTGLTLISLLGLAVCVVPLVMRLGIVGAGFSALIGSLAATPLIFYYLFRVFK